MQQIVIEGGKWETLTCTLHINDKEKKTFKLNKKRKTEINENMDYPINPVLFFRKYHISVLLHNYFRRHINFSTCQLQISQEMPEQA